MKWENIVHRRTESQLFSCDDSDENRELRSNTSGHVTMRLAHRAPLYNRPSPKAAHSQPGSDAHRMVIAVQGEHVLSPDAVTQLASSLSISAAMKLAAHRVAGTAMSALTTGVQYLGSNDASYDDLSVDSGQSKNSFVLGSKEVIFSAIAPVFPTNISGLALGNATAVESVDAPQCAENLADNLECFMILTPSQQLAIVILALTLGTFTVLENFMVLCVILHSQTLRSRPSYHFIGSLAVADLIGSIIFVYSFLDFHVLHRKDSPNVFLFKLAGVIASFTASVGSLFLTAIDRYISIHRPMAYKRIVTKTKAVIAFSMMWTISIVISLLPLLGWNCKRLGSVCSDIFPLIDRRYLMFWIGITSVLVLFIIYAYMFILWKSHHHAVRMLSRTSQRSVIIYTAEGAKVQTVRPEQARMDLRLAKTLVMILVALIICWGPLLAIMVYDLFGKVDDFIKTVFAFCSMLCLLNSTVNPVIYAMRSKDLRRAFRNICRMWRGGSQTLDSSAESDWTSRSMRAAAAAAAAAGRAERKRGRHQQLARSWLLGTLTSGKQLSQQNQVNTSGPNYFRLTGEASGGSLLLKPFQHSVFNTYSFRKKEKKRNCFNY
ncbi:hypothetical protein CCH79_00015142 [Gambusia affinis]|uniref:G-protein coupled receptors family 1 profile domain-containing protein n=1 Tax=Gambusia affinis TaxID=33528 RepID=A0A315VHT0_GAMAF|nr:hypothetical protein CCH79_00015142 [Gambusia affinis]